MKRLTYANVMSTLAMFLALGGTSYAVATRNPVKIIKAPTVVAAGRTDANGTLTATGWGSATATCPRGYWVVGGGPFAFTADDGALTPTTSAPNAAGRGWVVVFDNYSTRSQAAAAYATCVRHAAL